MRFNLENYTLGYKVFSIAFNNDVFEKLKDNNLNCALFTLKGLLFYPENIVVEFNEENKNIISTFENYDVLFVSDKGKGFLHFGNAKDDNPLVVTQKCNSNCIMCPTPEGIRRKESEMWIDPIIESIKYIPSDAKHLTITGGEPFIVKEKLFDLLHSIKNRLCNTECLLLTNGRALCYKPYAEKFYLNAPTNIIVGIPLHGYNSDTHDYITQSKGGFEQTIMGIKNLLYYGFKVEIRMVVSKLNYEFIDKIADLIIEEIPMVDSVKIMGLEMFGNAAKNIDKVWIPYKTAFSYSKNAIMKLIKSGIDVMLYNFPLCSVDREYHLLCAKSISGYKVRYDNKCNECTKKEMCGGIFSGTIRLAGNDVKPWSK